MNAVIVRKFDAMWVEKMDHRVMVVRYEDFRMLGLIVVILDIMAARTTKVKCRAIWYSNCGVRYRFSNSCGRYCFLDEIGDLPPSAFS